MEFSTAVWYLCCAQHKYHSSETARAQQSDNARSRGNRPYRTAICRSQPAPAGLVDVRDVEFAHLLLVWCACQSPAKLQKKDQFQAVKNFKNAARYDLESSRIAMPDGSCKSLRRAGIELLVTMLAFFGGISAASVEVVDFELDKFVNPQHRYAPAVRKRASLA